MNLKVNDKNGHIQCRKDKLTRIIRKKKKIIISEIFSIEFLKNIDTDLGHIRIKQIQRMICSVFIPQPMTKNKKNL